MTPTNAHQIDVNALHQLLRLSVPDNDVYDLWVRYVETVGLPLLVHRTTNWNTALLAIFPDIGTAPLAAVQAVVFGTQYKHLNMVTGKFVWLDPSRNILRTAEYITQTPLPLEDLADHLLTHHPDEVRELVHRYA